MNSPEDSFWLNEQSKYAEFKKNNPSLDYHAYFPEKTYPALVTAMTIELLVKDVSQPMILEPGCGIAVTPAYLANYGIRTVGLETSKDAISFAKSLSRELTVPSQQKRVNLLNKDFYKYKTKDTFDIVYNSGVLEHFSKDEQLKFLERMKRFSHRYIMIMVTNIKSLIFQQFLSQMQKQGRKYVEKHKPIDVENLFKQLGISIVKKTGRNIWLQNYKPRNTLLKEIYKTHFDWVNTVCRINAATNSQLAYQEMMISDEVLFNHAFTQVFIGSIAYE